MTTSKRCAPIASHSTLYRLLLQCRLYLLHQPLILTIIYKLAWHASGDRSLLCQTCVSATSRATEQTKCDITVTMGQLGDLSPQGSIAVSVLLHWPSITATDRSLSDRDSGWTALDIDTKPRVDTSAQVASIRRWQRSV